LIAALDHLAAAQRADHTAKGAYEDVMARFVATQAPRLAAELRPDEPCPVCGSTTHPSPAEPVGDDAVDHDAVDTARSTWTRASNKMAALDSVIAGLREALGADAESPIDAFQDLVAEADIALQHARAAVAELSTTRSDLAALAAALADANESALAKQHELATRSGAAESLRAEATRLVDVVADIDEAKVDANLAVHRTLDAALDGLADAFDGATATATVLAEATSRLADELVASGCADVAAARATLLDAAEEIRRIDRADQWRRDVAAQQARLHTLTEQGIPDERPDVDAADASASEANRVANAATEAFTTAANALRTAGSELDRAIAVSAGSAELRAERDDARVVFKTCNGEAGIRVKLERWVLAGELDRVTTAANDHLARMTNHRYTLQRSGAKGGLALEVFDAHTGRARPTASLSGGEQFQASLSLALGLADVVSHGGSASGRQFEALFVDEGFGSLDPNALDDAIRALAQLHAAGRMVGAITHVEAMKQQLHVGIEVSALADGRGSTLTVYP
jgi:exonuclease SbcC